MIEVTIESDLVNGIHRLDTAWGAEKLSQKIEQITGVPPAAQQLDWFTPSGVLGEWPAGNGWLLRVTDTGDSLPNIVNDGDIENRYKMSQEQYEQREDSVLAWKRKNQLGRFAPNQPEVKPTAAEEVEVAVSVGDECYAKLNSGKTVRASVAYVGPVEGIEPGTWVGLRLANPDGKNDGSVRGVRLFTAEPNHGALVRPAAVHPIDEDEEEL